MKDVQGFGTMKPGTACPATSIGALKEAVPSKPFPGNLFPWSGTGIVKTSDGRGSPERWVVPLL